MTSNLTQSFPSHVLIPAVDKVLHTPETAPYDCNHRHCNINRRLPSITRHLAAHLMDHQHQNGPRFCTFRRVFAVSGVEVVRAIYVVFIHLGSLFGEPFIQCFGIAMELFTRACSVVIV